MTNNAVAKIKLMKWKRQNVGCRYHPDTYKPTFLDKISYLVDYGITTFEARIEFHVWDNWEML